MIGGGHLFIAPEGTQPTDDRGWQPVGWVEGWPTGDEWQGPRTDLNALLTAWTARVNVLVLWTAARALWWAAHHPQPMPPGMVTWDGRRRRHRRR
jgi:hypothetical protein